MKPRRALLLSITVVLALCATCGIWLNRERQQYRLNRQLIAALIHNDTKTALALVNAAADPNTRYTPPPAPTLRLLLKQLLHRSPVFHDDSPTALMFASGENRLLLPTKSILVGSAPENVPLVQAMLEHGGDCNTIEAENGAALHCAVISNHLHVAQLLLEQGAHVNAQNRLGGTPLMDAAANSSVDMTRLLLEHGADVAVADRWGDTALHTAMRYEKEEGCTLLLLAHGANPNQKDKSGRTPLQLAQTPHWHKR